MKIISPGSRTRDFTVYSRYNYRYAAKTLHQDLRSVAVVVPTVDREIPGSTPGRYNLQIKITSQYVLYGKGWQTGTRMGLHEGPLNRDNTQTLSNGPRSNVLSLYLSQ